MPEIEKKGSEGEPVIDPTTGEPQKPKVEQPPEKPKELTSEDIQKLLSTNARLLEESKANKAALRKFQADEEARATAALEAEKKYPELIAAEKKKNQLISDKVLAQGIAFAIQKKCADAVDFELISKLIKIDKDNLDTENLVITDLSAQLDAIRKDKPYLFKPKGAGMNQHIPTYSPDKPDGTKPLAEMKNEDLTKLIGEGLVKRLN